MIKYKVKTENPKWAFSIIEILVWIFIFSLWIISVFSIIVHTLNLNEYNKNYIIATNLAREQIELVRNIRDSNYKKIQIYNQINPALNTEPRNVFQTWTYYKIENDFSSTATFPVKVEKIEDFWEWINELNETSGKMKEYQLCLSENSLYAYCNWWGTVEEIDKTYFYKYIKIEELSYNEAWVENILSDAFKVISKVIWYNKWYKEFEITSIFTDFKRF
jgi:Tfp pilus assembly protein PilV